MGTEAADGVSVEHPQLPSPLMPACPVPVRFRACATYLRPPKRGLRVGGSRFGEGRGRDGLPQAGVRVELPSTSLSLEGEGGVRVSPIDERSEEKNID
ncbi:MAG: hypothetical protein ACLQGU_08950 [bacterium]